MSRLAVTVIGLAFATTAAESARASFVPVSPGTGYYTGVDAGVGPNDPRWSPSANPPLDSVAAASEFQTAVGSAASTLINFGPAFSGLQPTRNDLPSQDVNGLQVTTQGISYNTPPPHYQYGVTSSADPVANSASLGYGIGGSSRYEFVPLLNAGTASFTLHSDAGFQSFGFYLTGLGNLGGVVNVALDCTMVPGLTLGRSGGAWVDGGVLFLGYVGTAQVHDLTIVMPYVNGPSRDVFALDDVELVSVPEPSSLVLTGVGLAGMFAARVRRNRRPSPV